MGRFDRTEGNYIDQKIRRDIKFTQIGRVVDIYEHTDPNDKKNFEVDVLLRDEQNQRRGIPVAFHGRDTLTIPQEDDLVLVEFLDGDDERPIVTRTLYTNQTRPPLGKAGMIRYRRGDLYFEADPDGDWMRIAQKSSDDDDGASSNARLEIDDSGADPELFIEAENADININISNGNVKLGDPSGTFKRVAREGDAVEDGSGNQVGTISEGSDDVQST